MDTTLDRKLSAIHADPHGCREFILADAKDADMAFGIGSAGKSPESHSGELRYKSLEQYREQMRQIQKELGEGDDSHAEIAELDRAIADAHMPEEVEKTARKELTRLERMPEAAPEYSVVRTYLEWLIELPWASPPQPSIDIAEARRILDEDHFGLEKIKRRILHYLAVRQLKP